MSSASDAGQTLQAMWDRIDDQDWAGLAAVLHPDLHADYVHTGETFGKDELVALNQEYPGRWRATIDDMVVDGEQAVSRTRVCDGAETYHVASFARVRAGTIIDLVEVWTGGTSRSSPGYRST